MKIVVPMAGRGARFAKQGLTTPKPLIPVAGQPMILRALQSIAHVSFSQIIFIALAEHERDYSIKELLSRSLGVKFEIILLDEVTDGQLRTVLMARELIDVEEDLLIISSDTHVQSQIEHDIRCRPANCHGLISVARMPGDRWSFARVDETDQVLEVAEKIRISDWASTGMYYFANGCNMVQVADELITGEEKTHGEYYVILVYQKYIQRGWNVYISRATAMWDMGTPESLAQYEAHLAEISLNQPGLLS